jgi:hypothetical protein
MIKELSYLRESVRIELDCDCRFSEPHKKAIMKIVDNGIRNIGNGNLRMIK